MRARTQEKLVAAYVDYIHYVERVHTAVAGPAPAHGAAAAPHAH